MTTLKIETKTHIITITTHDDGKRDLRFYDAAGKSLAGEQGAFIDGVAGLMSELIDARAALVSVYNAGLLDGGNIPAEVHNYINRWD